MVVRTVALVLGVVFLLIGILGFVPGVTTGEGYLLGIFAVNPLHNVVHLVVGVLGVAAYYWERYARLYCQVLGVFYLVIGVLGFIPGITVGGDMLLGVIHVNLADNLLHLVVGAVAAYFGFAPQYSGRVSPTT
ncbi:conserved hypothetical protein [Rubrobacter xylanophilus DSM 9941]|uniref:DUF4383 domain-containing protein n=1 Tax=Rubrobacter xylanophilus (strain DSM 9941 / JCM 11954 / NBRC 16129 / PRD-1) TaxID=266117 RepID=Q1AXS2_RUBXD|nr:DUF4383 domain-containing protein [Rubrobacter xylanophilus]ABG03806.1 conserved hypothetical protein [Rubrobacter xylanophilus DSM 9941]